MVLELKKWDVAEQLETNEDMQPYLEACMEEDEGLYKALSSKGNSSFTLILKLSRALGLHLKIAI